MIVASIKGITFTFVQKHDEALLQVRGQGTLLSVMIVFAKSQIIIKLCSPTALIISITIPDGPAAFLNFIFDIAFTTISNVIRIGRPSKGFKNRHDLILYHPKTYLQTTFQDRQNCRFLDPLYFM